MKNKDGGPAFPVVGVHGTHLNGGMTLRDYFAANALQGYLSNPTSWQPIEAENAKPEEVSKVFACFAYLVADAMLKAREE